ncbi:MAG TPA: DNA-processing protein DprA [Pseudoduganella sp.]
MQDTVSSPSSRQDLSSLADWLRLARTPGITRLTANLLLAEYGSPQAVLAAARQVLASSLHGASSSAAAGSSSFPLAASNPVAASRPFATDSPVPPRPTAAADLPSAARAYRSDAHAAAADRDDRDDRTASADARNDSVSTEGREGNDDRDGRDNSVGSEGRRDDSDHQDDSDDQGDSARDARTGRDDCEGSDGRDGSASGDRVALNAGRVGWMGGDSSGANAHGAGDVAGGEGGSGAARSSEHAGWPDDGSDDGSGRSAGDAGGTGSTSDVGGTGVAGGGDSARWDAARDDDSDGGGADAGEAGAEEAEAGAGEAEAGAGSAKLRKRIVVREGDKVQMTLAAAKLLCASLPGEVRRELEAAKLWLQGEGNIIITQADKEYPPLLRHIPDPPLVLYVKGKIELLQNDALAIVGSRNATHQGRTHAEDIARAVSSEGMTIVSGLALGIDAAAHTGGLHAKGGTIAVVGTGIDRIYPARNADLARAIAQEGCLVSEFALGAPARPHNFPIRNRIIAGIARATLVVEATARSGSRITAHQAMHFGREVLVMPGSVQSPFSQGSHALIREGARLAGCAQHVLEDLGLRAPESISFMLTGTASELLEQLSFDPISADELATRLQLDPAQTQASLLALELAGVVERLPGGAFQRAK